ncbi:nicotinamide mononucleotide transporter [Phragmitibacter flavus]|uniref:Nicotinamide riboside transporter PnuC n=1 Tax=Phragmitibacter flavus TaxID=2576071 RepID=A0A5R8KF85_9BACT|nr:nicotinamide riboside transporter PnuC [Phragmitibacter flavus]TLD70970.1 nicotinamide mononucleotide transporter [Phragmitibacter flavus]
MTSKLEIAANAVNAISILLAARNQVHTWWTGIIGCVLFAALFYQARLYADVTLQGFFIITCLIGWHHWKSGNHHPARAIRHVQPKTLLAPTAVGATAALAYGWLLHQFTNAYAPFLDSFVLAFSVIAQLLLVRRYYESWWGWLLVNSIAVPLFYSRGLHLTALLYLLFWINAITALIRWKKWMQPP